MKRVERLYSPQKLNLSPRIGITYDPFGDGKSALRAGFSMAYQPHHGQSIGGARANPPDAVQGVIRPGNRIGTQILYDIPVPYNPEFGRGLNDHGGVISRPGEPPIRISPWVVNPTIKTQYSESWFFNVQREVAKGWIAEVGYFGTKGVNLERIDDINRFTGDLADGAENRINPNFGVIMFVTNGVDSELSRGHRRDSASVQSRIFAPGELSLLEVDGYVIRHFHRPVHRQFGAREGRAGRWLSSMRQRPLALRYPASIFRQCCVDAERRHGNR